MEELAGSNPELGRVVGLVLRDAAAIEGPAAKIKRMNSLGWTMSMGSAMSKAQSCSSRTTQTSDAEPGELLGRRDLLYQLMTAAERSANVELELDL